MAKAIAITFAATSMVLSHISSAEQQTVIDIEVIKETEKAVLVGFKDEGGDCVGESQWLPKKALIKETILSDKVFIVKEWFETLDNVCIDKLAEDYGYQTQGINIDLAAAY